MSKDKIIKQIPNILTISRIVGSILLAFIAPVLGIGLTTACVAALALTDLFDGFLARKLNASSELGGKLDAISDKLFIAIIMYVTIRLGSPYANALLFPIAGETSIAVLNTVKYKLGYKPQTIIKGKIKTWALSGFVIVTFLQMEFEFLKSAVECLLACTLTGQIITFMGYCDQENELNNDKKIYNKIDEIKRKIKDKRKTKSIKIEPIDKVKGDDLNMEKDNNKSLIRNPLAKFLETYRVSNSLTIDKMADILGLDVEDLKDTESGLLVASDDFYDSFESKFSLSEDWKKILDSVKEEMVGNIVEEEIQNRQEFPKEKRDYRQIMVELRKKNKETIEEMAERISGDIGLNIQKYYLCKLEDLDDEVPINFTNVLSRLYELTDEEKSELQQAIFDQRKIVNGTSKTLY